MFRGWRIVAIASPAQAVSTGLTFYVYGLFLAPIEAEFGASRLAATLGLTLLILVQGCVSPLLGRIMDRGSIRVVMTVGALLLALGLLLLSSAKTFWQVGLLFATLVAVGSHCFGPLATSTLVAKWFSARRGRALGIAAVGASFGGFVFPPLVAALLDYTDWRGAMQAMGFFVAFCAIPLALFIRSRPEEVGEVPDGTQAATGEIEPRRAASLSLGPTTGGVSPGFGTRELLRSRNLWAITASLGLAWCSVGVLLAHLIPFAMDRGFSAERAAYLMSVYAGAGIFGRIAFGSLADRFDKRVVAGCAVLLLAVGWSGFLVVFSYPWMLTMGIAMGFGVGGLMPLWGALTGACFGGEAFGRAMGLMNPLMFPFNLAGAPIAAWLYDRTGDYTMAFAGFLGTFVVSIAILGLLRVPAIEPGFSREATARTTAV